uniref:EF-hand domain-containing protein n=1 Tax=Cyanistes caeruleus TaxID=156563 RepID=A0A8C0UDH0_CYACU
EKSGEKRRKTGKMGEKRERMMKKLDMNSDGQLDFQEFLNLIGGIAVACHDSLLLKPQNP